MKENDVAYISEQFGLDAEIVKASVEDGTLRQRIKDATKDQVVYKSTEDFEKFKTNLKTEVETNYFNDLVDKAHKGDVPQGLYAPIKGAALQQFERDTAKKFGVDDYKDASDLIDQLVRTSANGKGDEETKRLIEENQNLKSRNSELAQEKEDALKTVEQKYKDQFIQRDKLDVLRQIPIDFSDVKSDELGERKEKVHKILTSVFDTEYSLDYNDKGNLIVKKGDDILKDPNTYEPIPVANVMSKLAVDYGYKLTSPDSGGQGGKSSAGSTAAFSSIAEFEATMKERGISASDPKYIEAWNNSGLSKRNK